MLRAPGLTHIIRGKVTSPNATAPKGKSHINRKSHIRNILTPWHGEIQQHILSAAKVDEALRTLRYLNILMTILTHMPLARRFLHYIFSIHLITIPNVPASRTWSSLRYIASGVCHTAAANCFSHFPTDFATGFAMYWSLRCLSQQHSQSCRFFLELVMLSRSCRKWWDKGASKFTFTSKSSIVVAILIKHLLVSSTSPDPQTWPLVCSLQKRGGQRWDKDPDDDLKDHRFRVES